MHSKKLALLIPFIFLAACDANVTSPTDPMESGVAPVLAAKENVQKPSTGGRGKGELGTVYVSSQGLYYDTFVSADVLPPHGRFQKLENGVTEFGPGDPGYLGGRWWIDSNGNDQQDPGDTYLLCPLLGPGRTTA
ncbi:MAG: hypothetical protein PVJ80_13465 [Gemmatimonadota bacterium]|jgi:hypothetical protein